MKLNLQSFSQLIIFLPLIILGLLTFSGSKNTTQTFKEKKITPTLQVSTKSSTNINLKGQSICTINDSEIQAKIFIKNYSISGTFISKNEKNIELTTQVILKGDCVYTWMKGDTLGQKLCGVKQYLSLYEKISSITPIDIGSLVSILQEFVPKGTVTGDQASMSASLSKSKPVCDPRPVDSVVFEIPKGITFKETPLN